MLSFFDQVKEAFKSNREGNLEGLGVKILGKNRSAEWLQAQCPLCADKNGSASFSLNGHLRCHQCNEKLDLFEWTSRLWTCTPWDACQKLCGQFNVSVDVQRARGAKPPRQLTRSILRAGTMDLWTHDEAEPFRKFLQQRKLDDAQLLEKFGVAFVKGNLIFAQYDYFSGGALRSCYRRYVPIGKKWFWVGTGAKGGFWPYYEVPDGAIIWILEGEWDVLTAWIRLRLQEQGIYCFTWTSTGAIPGHLVPDAWRKKEVHLLYDNDTFQGTHNPRAPSEKQLVEQEARFKKLRSHAAGFYANGCQVSLRHVPIDPLENYGADLRDWVDAGNVDITKLPITGFKDFREREPEAIECELGEVGKHVGKRVRFNAMVEQIADQDLHWPKSSSIDCEMGTATACRSCLVPGKFPQMNIWFPDYQSEMANAMMARRFDGSIQKTLLGMPRSCPRCELHHDKYDLAALWIAVKDDELSQGITIPVISKETPTLSGEIEVDGYVYRYRDANKVVVLAKEIEQLDKAKVDLTPHSSDLKLLCPGDTSDPKEIDAYMRERAADLAFNVTKIHGREDVHIAHDLLMHSSIGYIYNGMLQRGWIDAGIVGPTRTGKTMVFDHLFKWHGIGKIWAAMQGITVAGLTMGAVQSPKKGYILKPGLFPRSHKKVLVLDEFHVFNKDKEHPIMFLQSARDLGRCDSIKISGSRSLPAAVRFCTISNWPRARGPGRFPCRQFLSLYQKPEALSRADFILVVPDELEDRAVEAESLWTPDLARALILRAWAMDPELVQFTPNAFDAAHEFIEECRGVFSERIPLFTPEASFYSLLRMSQAAANVGYSCQPGNSYASRVTSGYVKWAASWVRHTWEMSKYDKFSENEVRQNEVLDPFRAEVFLTTKLDLNNPREALQVLEGFLNIFREAEVGVLIGCEAYDAHKWFTPMLRNNMFRKADAADKHFTNYEPTRDGETILRNLIDIAEGYPDLYRARYDRLKTWSERGMQTTLPIPPLNQPLRFIIHEQDRQPSSTRDSSPDEIPF